LNSNDCPVFRLSDYLKDAVIARQKARISELEAQVQMLRTGQLPDLCIACGPESERNGDPWMRLSWAGGETVWELDADAICNELIADRDNDNLPPA